MPQLKVSYRVRAARAAIGVSAVLLVSANGAAWATEPKVSESVIVAPGKAVEDDLIVAGGMVRVQATVLGDVIAAGQNVTVSGKVKGDVAVAGQNVAVSGPVGDDLRAAGANLSVYAPVGDNASLAGGTVHLEPAARIGRDLDIAGGDIYIQGPVRRNLRLTGDRVRIAAVIDGSVDVTAQNLTLLPGASIGGNLLVKSPKPPVISPQARVAGKVDFRPEAAAAAHRPQQQPGAGIGDWLGGWLLQFAWLFALGAAVIAFSPRWPERVRETMTARLGPSALVGLLLLAALPVIGAFLLLTLVGIPLSLLLMTLYGAALIISGVFAAYCTGAWALARSGRSSASPYARMAVGALLLTFLASLPALGWLVRIGAIIIGLGALALERQEARSWMNADTGSGGTPPSGLSAAANPPFAPADALSHAG